MTDEDASTIGPCMGSLTRIADRSDAVNTDRLASPFLIDQTLRRSRLASVDDSTECAGPATRSRMWKARYTKVSNTESGSS
jgi:hypothetical protein